ncbi:peptidoglycan-binding protein [Virgibacillus pantothenticus]|uniref:S41 family peptidase n=1 Tax=Virgibacillus pantothenticus TaxID=1473 RepID=UPI001C23F64F|nr:S41 family peptidase [Virgibacillus pantothenticus]MBU8566283.1 peptidoglycan-binding protein [Virgibacillus pantothenticus]MBU8600707.1 peptidoglycan-binding protein [Virgibacillus pantothenticus]MBU8634585.1 peptidoglycan-binding protein [Virgibacillus pantothenticus]MBU8640813.1 peptidoglycan-binding protein [Virgibacillus pantothenticus]MBU8646432.1 peptidoglycan-binding protein [Virgibacillus pantothenticus]
MKLRKLHIVLLFILALAVGLVGGYAGVKLAQKTVPAAQQSIDLSGDSESNESVPENIEKIDQAFQLIKENYLEDVDDKQLTEGAIQGMLSTLEDPYSSYLDAETMKKFNEQIESSFEGIGAEVNKVGDVLTIVAPVKDSPAEKAGLRPNDQVLRVDGESLEGLSQNESVAKIRGEKGTEVELTIRRSGVSDPFKVAIVRDTIPQETVYSKITKVDGKKTGILEVTNFSERTAQEFNEQLKKMEDDGIEGLVIDVRGNPGGLLNVVEDMLKQFVPEDMPYLQVEDQNGKKTPYYSDLKQKKEYPISVLIDEGSASASEILAVAMKEMGYDVVGQPSFGKGTIQQAVPLGDESTIKLTFSKWLSPKGNWIHEKGVEPTVKQKQPAYYYTSPVQIKDPLTQDQTGDKIKNIQVMLKGLGYDPGRTDGYFSAKTAKAVEAFQQDNDLSSSGNIDEKTAKLIETKVINNIREGKDDQQLETALKEVYQ